MPRVLAGAGVFAQARVTPMLATGVGEEGPQPARRSPATSLP